MKKQINLSDVKKYFEQLKSYETSGQKQDGRFIYSLSKKAPFLFFTAMSGAIGAGALLANWFGLYGVAAGLIPGGLAGFFAPKIIHNIKLGAKGKTGQKYAKNKLAEYVDLRYSYNLLAFSKILEAGKDNPITEEDLKKFVDSTYDTAVGYKNVLNKYVLKKIKSRKKHDFKKITKMLNPDKSVDYKKIDAIIAKYKKDVAPWCDVYNQYAIVAKDLMQYAYLFNPDIEMPADNSYFVDENNLLIEVNDYMTEHGFVPKQFEDLFEEQNPRQNIKKSMFVESKTANRELEV